jgi:hypothetical protein
LIAWGFIEQSIRYALAAEETKSAGSDDNIKSDVKKKDCKDNNNNGDDNSDACLDSKSKDSVTPKSLSDTTENSQNNDDNKKHKDPFLLPFP